MSYKVFDRKNKKFIKDINEPTRALAHRKFLKLRGCYWLKSDFQIRKVAL